MNEKARKKAVYGIFVLAVLFGVYMKPWDRSVGSSETSVGPGEGAALPDTAVGRSADSAAPLFAGAFESEWPVDPFAHRAPIATAVVMSSSAEEPALPAFTLQGMMQLGGEPACVIDGVILKAGDRIQGWTVESVSATEVVLRQGSERQRLRIN